MKKLASYCPFQKKQINFTGSQLRGHHHCPYLVTFSSHYVLLAQPLSLIVGDKIILTEEKKKVKLQIGFSVALYMILD